MALSPLFSSESQGMSFCNTNIISIQEIEPRAPMPNLSGHTIENGRLKLLNVLGSGAYGVVYRALDTTSPRHAPIFYAVKCLRKSGLDDGHFASQNVEIDLHRKVSGHKNVLTFHRVLQEADFMFIILDLCPGGDMFFAITKHHFYHKNDHRIKAAILQIIDAVSFIHDAQVFHRDLKPENILCGPDGLDIRIADFGLATDTYTGRTSGCGSATHMSPEAIGEDFSHYVYSTRHSDIWAVGVILVNLITESNVWCTAALRDPRFARYYDTGALDTDAVVSTGANKILRRIFKIEPLSRISLRQLREAILGLDTFYAPTTAPPKTYCKASADYPFALYPSDLGRTRSDRSSNGSVYGIREAEYPEERYLFPSPDPDAPCAFNKIPRIISSTHGDPPIEAVLRYLDDANSFLSLGDTSLSNSSSGTESLGPVTPLTQAVDPDVEVPDFSEGESLDQPLAGVDLSLAAVERSKETAAIPTEDVDLILDSSIVTPVARKDSKKPTMGRLKAAVLRVRAFKVQRHF